MPFLNQRAYPSLARHFPHAALQNSPYFSPALGAPGAFAYLAAQGAQADGQKVREREDKVSNGDGDGDGKTHARGGACRVWLQTQCKSCTGTECFADGPSPRTYKS